MSRKVTIDLIMQNGIQAVVWIWSLGSFNTLATAQQWGWAQHKAITCKLQLAKLSSLLAPLHFMMTPSFREDFLKILVVEKCKTGAI